MIWISAKKLFVLKNKGVVSEPEWSEIVNGLGVRLISKKLSKVKDYTELKLTIEVKNFGTSDVSVPYPQIHEYSYEEGGEDSNFFKIKVYK